jgi:hypothetical protein
MDLILNIQSYSIQESKNPRIQESKASKQQILQLRLKVLKLAQILDHPGALASRETSLPGPDVLDQDRLLLLLLVVSVHLLNTIGLDISVSLSLLRSCRRRGEVQRRQNLLQKTFALLCQRLDLLLCHASRVAEVRRHGGQDTLRVCVGVEVEFGQALGESGLIDGSAT